MTEKVKNKSYFNKVLNYFFDERELLVINFTIMFFLILCVVIFLRDKNIINLLG